MTNPSPFRSAQEGRESQTRYLKKTSSGGQRGGSEAFRGTRVNQSQDIRTHIIKNKRGEVKSRGVADAAKAEKKKGTLEGAIVARGSTFRPRSSRGNDEGKQVKMSKCAETATPPETTWKRAELFSPASQLKTQKIPDRRWVLPATQPPDSSKSGGRPAQSG